MDSFTFRFNVLFILFGITYVSVNAVCTSTPAVPSNGYSLTQNQASYATNDVYTIVCLPGYTLVGSQDLTCTASGSWSSDPPTCSSNEGKYSWWQLLICVVVVIILVPCCVPRILFCCCKKKKKDDDDDDDVKYRGSHAGGGAWRSGKGKPITPITDKGKHQLHNMDYDYRY